MQGSALKRYAKRGLLFARIPTLLSLPSRTICVVLSYHSIHPASNLIRDSYGEGITHEPDMFDQHVRHVARTCHPVDLDAVADALARENPLPRRAVAFTFDDGMKDNYSIAAPILERYNCRGTFFVVPGAVEEQRSPFFVRLRYAMYTTMHTRWSDEVSGLTWDLKNRVEQYRAFIAAVRYATTMARDKQQVFVQSVEKQLEVDYDEQHGCCSMTWEQIRDLRSRGHLIGGHTLSHPNLAQIPFAAASAEILDGRALIKERTGCDSLLFAYPNPTYSPNWDASIAEFLRMSGFRIAVTSEQGGVKPGDSPYAVRRLGSGNDLSEFKWRMEAAFGLSWIRSPW